MANASNFVGSYAKNDEFCTAPYICILSIDEDDHGALVAHFQAWTAENEEFYVSEVFAESEEGYVIVTEIEPAAKLSFGPGNG